MVSLPETSVAGIAAELERTRNDLRALRARLDGILSAAVDGLLIIDERGCIETFNPAAERIFGYRAEAVIGRNISMLMPSPDREQHDRYINQYLTTGVARIIGIGREVAGRRRDGSVFPMDLAVGELRSDGMRRFVGIVRDISARKRTESALQAREAELRLVIENAPVGIFMVTRTQSFKTVNPAFCRLTGRPREELLQMRFQDLVHEDDRAEAIRECERVLRAEQTAVVHELRLVHRDGHTVHATLHCGLVPAPGGDSHVVAQVVDRTEQIRTESDLREQREQLAHAGRLSTMGEMASGIAHEINQPLTAIATYAQASRRMLERGMGDTGEFRDALEQIGAQAERAGEIIRRLRTFMRKRESQTEIMDINEQLRAVIRLAEVDVRHHEGRIEAEFAEPLPAVMADAVQIQQVALNLIRNAVDATAGLPRERRVVHVRTLQPAPDTVEVAVEDHGNGVAPDFVDHLFTPFRTTKTQGMGLGLSISSSIISAHGGRLWYTPGDTGGAMFHISLPVALV